MTLKQYLDNKPLYYDEIDYSRMPRAYESVKNHIKFPKIIQIVGTNGKGSTGRFMAQMLLKQNLSVGHYTSPHIFNFNERIWQNGEDVSDDILQKAHERLQDILPDIFIDTLSYFEYATFLAILIFSEQCDYVVFEAGLGGEFDATTVFPKILSVVTPIGYDHNFFLGDTIEEIAGTKINSIENKVLLSRQYEKSVYEVAENISETKGAELFLAQDTLSQSEKSSIKKYVKENELPSFQELNLQTAYSAVKILGFNVDLKELDLSVMAGRCQKIAKNITIDVGHNIMAAKMLKENFRGKKVTLIYNSFKDKDYKKIIDILTPVIDKIEIIQMENQRGMATEEIVDICKQRDLELSMFDEIKKDKEYLVFGSFAVVEKFLKDCFEK
ncbi:MAG: bifunctional folylpolyglutamate synthase/dihydrofolate synthase [Sulfurospirillum sp.]